MTPTLSMIADACQHSKFMVDNECNVIHVDYHYNTSDCPKNEYPNGVLTLQYRNFDIEITSVISMNPHGTIILSTRYGTKYYLAFLMTNPNPFQ